ncbi:hypothetical protein PMAYCL1PPCAC_08693, partial [Pristionchus mayeri]
KLQAHLSRLVVHSLLDQLERGELGGEGVQLHSERVEDGAVRLAVAGNASLRSEEGADGHAVLVLGEGG